MKSNSFDKSGLWSAASIVVPTVSAVAAFAIAAANPALMDQALLVAGVSALCGSVGVGRTIGGIKEDKKEASVNRYAQPSVYRGPFR